MSRLTHILALTLFTLFSVAGAATYNVTVGDGGFRFQPHYVNNVTKGDIIRFLFVSIVPHTATQSASFDQPCQVKSQGSDSGVLAGNIENAAEWSITVSNASTPIWFHCAGSTNCATAGMVFAVNPTQDQTWDEFHSRALNTTIDSTVSSTPSSTSISSSVSPSGTGASNSAGVKVSVQKLTATVVAVALFIGLTIS